MKSAKTNGAHSPLCSAEFSTYSFETFTLTMLNLAAQLPPMHGKDKFLLKKLSVLVKNRTKPDPRINSAYLATSLDKRIIRGTFQGLFKSKCLKNYLDAYEFRFNRRKSKSIGKKIISMVQQEVK